MNRLYDVALSFFRPEQKDSNLSEYFASFKSIYEEFNTLMSLDLDLEKRRQQREKLAIIAFLSGMRSEYDSARSQILASGETSLTEAFSRANRSVRPTSFNPDLSERSGLVGHASYDAGGSRGGRGGRGGRGRRSGRGLDGKFTCYHCGGVGHTRDRCWKLHGKPPQVRSANVVSGMDMGIQDLSINSESPSEGRVSLSAAEYSHLMSQISTSAPATTSATTNASAFMSVSPHTWVIDSGASDHMTGNTGPVYEADDW
ncbi:uncharacterized protein LOC119995184 [Tripterygium wilfordii]|uniref:uncharacterized protein LOC119995184 n=1 Tax=Tripterygium wilfordii TaxID=458696 RepID=UPI0018F828E9|nr:uncharacterized protein LOC119995184 [Tripterygium wilfordii]